MSKTVIILTISLLSAICLFGSMLGTQINCSVSGSKAAEELNDLRKIAEKKSAYVNVRYQRFDKAFAKLDSFLQKKESITKKEIEIAVTNVLGELGDRHSRAKYIGDCRPDKFYLPFSIAPWKEDKILALSSMKDDSLYSFVLNAFPLLKSINDIEVKKYMYEYNLKDKYAPSRSRLARGVSRLYRFYSVAPSIAYGDTLRFTFSSWDEKSDTTLQLPLSRHHRKWRDVYDTHYDIENPKSLELMASTLSNNIGYIRIPEMFGRRKNEEYFDWLSKTMEKNRNANALILDIRNNSGGQRDLLFFFANYFLEKNEYHVANLVRFRDKITDSERKRLEIRNIKSYEEHNKEAKDAISKFMKNFRPSIELDENKFMDYFYMVLRNDHSAEKYHFNKPIYILQNEKSASAASVFASSFKGYPNIHLAGVKADGSSGMSQAYRLPLTELEIRWSRMISFQSSGELFDGDGVSVDYELERSVNQILGIEDAQLKALCDIINSNI